jgi:hypothetical protein
LHNFMKFCVVDLIHVFCSEGDYLIIQVLRQAVARDFGNLP